MFSLSSIHGFNAMNFQPTMLSGLVLWMDPSLEASLTRDGSNRISQMNDLSGNARNFTNGTLANQPTQTTTINGRNVLSFNGTSQYLEISSNITTLSSSSLFIVANMQSPGATRRLFSACNTALIGAVATYEIMMDQPNVVATRFLARGDSTVIALATSTDTNTGNFVNIGIRNGNTVDIYKNNAGNATATAAVAAATVNRWTLGCDYPGSTTPANFFNNTMGEVVLYNRVVTVEERRAVYSYLASKWKIA